MENVKINIYSKFLYLKNKLTYKNILKAIVIIATIVIAYNCLTKIAYADGFLSYGNSDDPYKNIPEGWGMFISEKYRNNYALDIIDTHGWELIDKAITGLTNIVFSGIVMISWFGVNIFRFCFTNDIAAGFANQLNSVLGSLNNGIFNNFFMIVFMISLFSIVYNLYKKNFSAIGSQILAVAIIYATTAFLSNGAVGFLSKTTEFSKTIGTSAIVAINGKDNNEGSLEDYSKTVVGTLWGNFVQQPWVMLEFDGKVPLNDENMTTKNSINEEALNYSKDILSEPYGSDEREKALESINEKFNKELFSKNGINTKLVSVCVLFVITLIKMIILIAVGMIQIGFQLMSILLILLLPFIMLIAIVPFFGGTNIIKGIARKYLGTQLGIIVSSFVLALLLLDMRIYYVQKKYSTKETGNFKGNHEQYENISDLNYSLLDREGESIFQYETKYKVVIDSMAFRLNNLNQNLENIMAFNYIMQSEDKNFSFDNVVKSGGKLYYDVSQESFDKINSLKNIKGIYTYKTKKKKKDDNWKIENMVTLYLVSY